MPLTLDSPVLQVDANVIHKVDTTNPENLFSMWTVFARCRDSVAQGRRLENLSWRLWNRETFCVDSAECMVAPSGESQPRDIRRRTSPGSEDLPQLSGSVDSVDEEAVDFTADSAPVDILRPRILRQDSCASSRSRGRERHITSGDLEKMVVSIIEAKIPLTAPLSIPTISPPSTSPLADEKAKSPPATERSGSTTSESQSSGSERASMESLQQPTPASEPSSRTIVVCGFSPSQMPSSRITSQSTKSPSPSAIPAPTAAPAPRPVQPKKQQAKFALGGSSGSGDDSYTDREQSLDTRKGKMPVLQQKKMLEVSGSSAEDNSLKSALHVPRQGSVLNPQKKTASFNSKQLVTEIASSVISEQSESDYIDESAIDDDDDSSEWEDSVEDGGKPSEEEKINFQRVDSTANLTSRRSLITLMLAKGSTRAQHLGNAASQSTSAISRPRTTLNGPALVASPNDSDEAPLMMKRGARAPMRSINEIPRSSAQPINATGSGYHHQAALSPRTTRRNMLATELTESLRRQLLWERSQKSQTANAVLKRHHTSNDIANLKQHPEKPCMKEGDNNSASWDRYFNKNHFGGYHAEGW